MKTQHTKSEYTLKLQEVQNIINSASSFRDRCIIKCLYYGGMRVSEVVNLEVQHIDFTRKQINIIESKFGKTRTIPIIDSNFLADLKHFIGKRDKNSVFGIKTRRNIQHIIKKTGEKACISHPDPTAKHINCHLFRHSIVRHLKSTGYPIEFIQKFVGHSSAKTTMDIYGTLSLNEMQSIVAKKTGDIALLGQDIRRIPEIINN
jgi:integrase/recombinase XerD